MVPAVTSGFLHASLLHIGFNMLLLFFLGRLLEPALGTPRFVALYFASLLAGSLGALILDPNALTVGASGAVFGLAGATFVIARGRGMAGWPTELGAPDRLQPPSSPSPPATSASAVHLGGLAVGFLCALVIVAGERGKLGPRPRQADLAVMIDVALIAAVDGDHTVASAEASSF